MATAALARLLLILCAEEECAETRLRGAGCQWPVCSASRARASRMIGLRFYCCCYCLGQCGPTVSAKAVLRILEQQRANGGQSTQRKKRLASNRPVSAQFSQFSSVLVCWLPWQRQRKFSLPQKRSLCSPLAQQTAPQLPPSLGSERRSRMPKPKRIERASKQASVCYYHPHQRHNTVSNHQ